MLTEHSSVLFTCNATGKKEKLWLVGKAQMPPIAFPGMFMISKSNAFTHKIQSVGCLCYIHRVPKLVTYWDVHAAVKHTRIHGQLPKQDPSHPNQCGCKYDPKASTAWPSDYTKYMIGNIMMVLKASEDITDLVKMTVFDTILNTKVAWDTVPESTIIMCSRWCGIQQQMDLPTHNPKSKSS